MRKAQWYQKPQYIISIIAVIGVTGTGIVTLADYIKLPKVTEALAGQVQATDRRVYDVEKYIEAQQKANELQMQWQQEQQQYYQAQQQYWQQQQQQYYNPPQYQAPADRCWAYWTDGNQYEIDCKTGNWL